MAAGWLIGVLMEAPDEPAPLRRYFAVARADRAQAEWAAVDLATAHGRVASSPASGVEPVEAEGELPAPFLTANGVKPGMARDLGFLRPRRWLDAVVRPPPAA
jgi:hypothetical protein